MVKGTFDPKDPLSKEHWLNSFGTASVIFGGRKATYSIEKASMIDHIPSNEIFNKTSYVKSIDFSKLGTGNVGDFSNLKGSTIDEILSRIPKNAAKRELKPIEGKVEEGFEYKWKENDATIRVRVHGPDTSYPGSNASEGWVVRIQQGKKYMDSTGKFHPEGISNAASPYYSEELINDTHIPIQNP